MIPSILILLRLSSPIVVRSGKHPYSPVERTKAWNGTTQQCSSTHASVAILLLIWRKMHQHPRNSGLPWEWRCDALRDLNFRRKVACQKQRLGPDCMIVESMITIGTQIGACFCGSVRTTLSLGSSWCHYCKACRGFRTIVDSFCEDFSIPARGLRNTHKSQKSIFSSVLLHALSANCKRIWDPTPGMDIRLM